MKYETSSLTIEEFFGLKPKEVEPKNQRAWMELLLQNKP